MLNFGGVYLFFFLYVALVLSRGAVRNFMPGQRLFEAVPVAKSSFQERAHGRKDRERRMNKVSSVGRIEVCIDIL